MATETTQKIMIRGLWTKTCERFHTVVFRAFASQVSPSTNASRSVQLLKGSRKLAFFSWCHTMAARVMVGRIHLEPKRAEEHLHRCLWHCDTTAEVKLGINTRRSTFWVDKDHAPRKSQCTASWGDSLCNESREENSFSRWCDYRGWKNSRCLYRCGPDQNKLLITDGSIVLPQVGALTDSNDTQCRTNTRHLVLTLKVRRTLIWHGQSWTMKLNWKLVTLNARSWANKNKEFGELIHHHVNPNLDWVADSHVPYESKHTIFFC